jgi:Zn-dependent protease with chaperone function
MTSYPGVFNNGQSSVIENVRITPAPHGVAIDRNEEKLWWPFDGLFIQRSANAIVFRKAHPVNESLTVDDPAFLQALTALNPRVAAGQPFRANSDFALQIGAIAAGTILALVALVWFGFPWVVNRLVALMPVALERKIGEASLAALAPAGKRCVDPSLQRIVRTLEKAAPENPYQFQVYVVDDPMVNAFAAPGGFIVMYRGLLDKTRRPEEAAAVLAHEMQHVLQRHSVRGLMRGVSIWAGLIMLTGGSPDGIFDLAGKLGSLHYQRGDESEADVEGLNLLVDAGVDPQAMVSMLELLDKAAGDLPAMAKYVSSHPLNKDRIERIRTMAHGRTGRRPLDVSSAWPPAKSDCRPSAE